MQVSPAIFNLMVIAVVLAAVALVAQAVALLLIARRVKSMREQVDQLLPKARSIMDSADETLTVTRNQVTEISARATQILDTTKTQVQRTDKFLTDATDRVRLQLDRMELVLDDSIGRVHQTVMLLNRGVLQPVRQASGVITGIRAALDYFARGGRPNVSQATSDEEMFI